MKKAFVVLLSLMLMSGISTVFADTAFPCELPVGSTMPFGRYEQDNNPANGPEDIEWIILEANDESALLISKYALDCKPYHAENVNVTWETCTLRHWLNSEFLSTAFTSDEQAQLVFTTVTADGNPAFSTDSGNDTQDRVWLPGIADASQYFASDDARMCAPTDYAIAQGALTLSDYSVDNRSAGWWWLRSPGSFQSDAVFISYAGTVSVIGSFASCNGYGVRPFIRIVLQ